jgi:adenosine deaminase
MDFTAFPKIELHIHLDCSISYGVAKSLQPGLREEVFREQFIAPPKCRDLAEFLACAQTGIQLLQTEHALRLVTLDLLEQMAAEQVIYTEIRFAPLLHTQGGLSPKAVMDTVTRALAEGQRQTGVQAGLLLCTLRSFTEAQGLQTAQLAQEYRDKGVVGFDIAGDEAGFPLSPHVPAFEAVHNYGLPATAHAGEARGAESVRQSLERLHVQRIGHGVRSLEEETVLQLLKEKNIHLEICPTSNIQTDIYETIADHKVDWFYQNGYSLSINTDGRTLVGVSLCEEYQKLHQAFGWGAEEFRQCNLYALDAAFLPNDQKKALKQAIEAGYLQS